MFKLSKVQKFCNSRHWTVNAIRSIREARNREKIEPVSSFRNVCEVAEARVRQEERIRENMTLKLKVVMVGEPVVLKESEYDDFRRWQAEQELKG